MICIFTKQTTLRENSKPYLFCGPLDSCRNECLQETNEPLHWKKMCSNEFYAF